LDIGNVIYPYGEHGWTNFNGVFTNYGWLKYLYRIKMDPWLTILIYWVLLALYLSLTLH